MIGVEVVTEEVAEEIWIAEDSAEVQAYAIR
jgi:hypothetical protein